MVMTVQDLWAQGSFGNIPKSVNYRDARIVDVGTMATDVYAWECVDSITNKVDTVLTTDQYMLWQSDGDIDKQAEAHRSKAEWGTPEVLSTHRRVGSFVKDILANYEYMVFRYIYPSVDADGNMIMLSSMAACPTGEDTNETRDVVIGTHITITSDAECPSNTNKGFAEADWGILMSLAGGTKIATGSIADFLHGPIITWINQELDNLYNLALMPSNNYNLVIMPDYQGYGITKDMAHPYLYQELTARQVVDATRYGIALYKNADMTKDFRHPLRQNFRTIACGYSQGGSVAMATHRFIEQNGLSEELHFVGSICGDGPYDPISTLMYYVGRDLEDKKMSMAVVMPLIIKGMIDSNPYMRSHKYEDYFKDEFLATGIIDWLDAKVMTTDDIEKKWAKMSRDGETTVFDSDGKAMMRDIMKPECYNYFVSLYNQYKDVYTTEGVPLPSHRGLVEDLHFALASNDITTGWVPNHKIMLFHSTSDTVVPFDNLEKAVNSINQEAGSNSGYPSWGYHWISTHVSTLGHDHVDSGVDFFKSDDNWDLMGNLNLRIFIAKDKLCSLDWQSQFIYDMPDTW